MQSINSMHFTSIDVLWIIANNVSDNTIGFESDFNEVSIFYKNKNIKDEKILKMKKSLLAEKIVERVINQLN